MKKQIKTIYIFGNPLLPFDSTPIELKEDLAKEFPNINFIIQDTNENLKPHQGELIIIDTVMDIDKVIVIDSIDDIEKIEASPSFSMHDFDLGFNLKLLKKIGLLDKILIFGVPPDLDKKIALKQLADLINEKISLI